MEDQAKDLEQVHYDSNESIVIEWELKGDVQENASKTTDLCSTMSAI